MHHWSVRSITQGDEIESFAGCQEVDNRTLWFSYHNSNVMSPVSGQGAIKLQQSMLGPQEAAKVGRVQGHHHGNVVHTAQWKKGLNQDVLVWLFFQHLKRKSKTTDSLPTNFTLFFFFTISGQIHLKMFHLWPETSSLKRPKMLWAQTTLPLLPVENLKWVTYEIVIFSHQLWQHISSPPPLASMKQESPQYCSRRISHTTSSTLKCWHLIKYVVHEEREMTEICLTQDKK